VNASPQERARGARRWAPGCAPGVHRALTWRDVEMLGKVRHDPARGGWYIDYRTVRWPGRKTPRRVRVTHCPDYGRLETEREAERVQLRIQSQVMDGHQLYDVLARYIDEVPEDHVMHRWRVEWLPEVRRRHRRGKMSAKRLEQFERYEARGYLAFWEPYTIRTLERGTAARWLAWLEEQFEHLSPKTLRHVVADFGTFTRWLALMGTIEKAPAMPRLEVPVYSPKVPEAGDVAKILDEIPEEIRGLWLARSLAGLRPSEARRLDVSDYRRGVLHIPAAKAKTSRPRSLDLSAVAPELDAWILAHRAHAFGAEPLFSNPRGDTPRWTESSERRVWLRALKAAQVEHVKPNEGGRHAFATHEIAEGTDPYAVKDWLGHTTLATTERYKSVTAVSLARRMRPSGPATDRGPKREKKS